MKRFLSITTVLLLVYSCVSLDFCDLEYPDLHKWANCVGLNANINLRTRILEVGKAIFCRNYLCTFGKFCLEGGLNEVLPNYFTTQQLAELQQLEEECNVRN